MKTEIFGFALALVMVVALGATSLPAMAAVDSSTGSFTLSNAAPDVTSVLLCNATDELTTETSMTPQTEYAVKIEAGDTNTMNDIQYIEVVIQSQGFTESDCATDQATYKYTKGSGWSMVGPGETTWSINGTDCKVPDDLNQMSGTWWLHFTPGKIAREATWNITATVQDSTTTDSLSTEVEPSMQWYGELTALDTSFSFDDDNDVNLGDVDTPIATPDDRNIDVKTIANGNYKLESKSGNWVGQGAGAETAILDWGGSLESGRFRLENDGNNTVITTNMVEDSYTPITNYTSVTASTAETGDTKGVWVWLSVADKGFIPQEYKGTFNLQIATD
jgi:hypothetical protein